MSLVEVGASMATLFFAEFNANRDFFFPGSMTGRGPVRIPSMMMMTSVVVVVLTRSGSLRILRRSLILGNFCPSNSVKEKVIKTSWSLFDIGIVYAPKSAAKLRLPTVTKILSPFRFDAGLSLAGPLTYRPEPLRTLTSYVLCSANSRSPGVTYPTGTEKSLYFGVSGAWLDRQELFLGPQTFIIRIVCFDSLIEAWKGKTKLFKV